MNLKDIEFIIKKIIPEDYLLKKRIERSIKKNYEKELKFVSKFADKTKDALDIGVYRGIYSYQLSKNFNMVHSFEPNPFLFPYLNKNLKKIIKNLNLYNLALSDKDGEAKLKLPIRTTSMFQSNIEELYKLGAASIHPYKTFNDFKEVNVKKTKLDNIKIGNKIGFIKIDVEGHEYEVIEGGKQTILENKPILLIEIEKRHSNRSVDSSINHINKLGYKSYYVKNNKLLLSDTLEDKANEQNYYFLPN